MKLTLRKAKLKNNQYSVLASARTQLILEKWTD